jgi:serralysin
VFRKAFLAPVVLAIVAVMAVPAGATWGRGGGSRPGTIVDVLVAKSSTDGFDQNPRDYDILITAATAADLVGALSDPAAQLTLFAPDDAAFVRTAQSLGFTGWDEEGAWNFLVGALTQLGNGDPIPVLTTVLLYHVAPERLGVFRVLFSRQIDTLANASFGVRFIQLVDNAPKLPNPYLNVFALDQRASNGVIHGITRVLIPVDIG